MLRCCVILHGQPIDYFLQNSIYIFSILRKVTSGKLEPIYCLCQLFIYSGRISSDVILMFDDRYLQKCEEFSGGETISADETGDLYKGLMCFMIVGMKSNIPLFKSCAWKRSLGEWLQEEIRSSQNLLQECKFSVLGDCDLCATITQQLCHPTKSYLLSLVLKTKISSLYHTLIKKIYIFFIQFIESKIFGIICWAGKDFFLSFHFPNLEMK